MNLNHLHVFRAVAEERSFTRAAKRLRADKAHLSRVVRALEDSLGVVLITRTTRSVALTPAGEGLLATVRGPLDALDMASRTIAERAKTPSGVVTLATTPDIARVLVAPLAAGFRARYAEISLRLRVGPEVEGLSDASLDLALRVGAQTNPDERVRKLGELEAGFFASPRYLAARGSPRALKELLAHETLWPHGVPRSSFSGGAPPPPPKVACDDFAVILAIARTGGGVGLLPKHLAKSEVREGALVRVLPEVTLRGAPLYLVTRRERPLPARVEALRAHLIANVGSLLA